MARWTRSVGSMLAAVSWVVPVAAAPDVYLSAGTGVADAPNGSFDGTGVNVDFDLGKPIGVLAVGLATGNGWRFELEGGYRYNDAEVVFFDDGGPDWAVDTDSRITATSLGINAIREFDTGHAFRPFLGVGVGAAWVDYEITQYITEIPMLDNDDTALTYQFIAGLTMSLGPRWAASLDYRYWRAPDIELHDVNGESFDTDHTIYSAMFHLHYGFGQRGTAPAAEPPPLRGWYARMAGGPARAKDAEIKDNIANFDAFDVGGAYVLAGGYAFAGPWRVELEAARHKVEAELIDFNPEFGEDRANGHVRARSLMANVLYEPRWRLSAQPYAGLGAGLAWSDWDVSLNADGATYVDDDDSAAAAQIILGAAAAFSDDLELTAEYRFWLTGIFDMKQPDGRAMETELTVHSVMLGLRFRL